MARDPKGIKKLATSASLDLFRYVRQNCNLEIYVGHNCILKCTVAVLFSVFKDKLEVLHNYNWKIFQKAG